MIQQYMIVMVVVSALLILALSWSNVPKYPPRHHSSIIVIVLDRQCQVRIIDKCVGVLFSAVRYSLLLILLLYICLPLLYYYYCTRVSFVTRVCLFLRGNRRTAVNASCRGCSPGDTNLLFFPSGSGGGRGCLCDGLFFSGTVLLRM